MATKKATPAKKAASKTSKTHSGSTRAGGSVKASSRSASGERLIDHDAIRAWAEERDATPACVKKTGGKGDVGMIRLDFPGYSGEESLKEISWEDWFRQFDESNLALIVQETTADGQRSNFNKLVKRTAEERPRTRAAR